jgi:hypothetical protein|tara:strand:- start:10354 stop:10674 length:321 start_codon:yes stop_codon:yes gene_type:complete
VADASVAFSGWNSSNTTWNSGTWGGDTAVPGATGALSAVTVLLNDSVTLTGIAASALLNGVTVIDGTGISVSVTGVQATGATNQVLVWGRIIPDATVTWTEIVATP